MQVLKAGPSSPSQAAQEAATNAPHLLALHDSLMRAPGPVTAINQSFAVLPLALPVNGKAPVPPATGAPDHNRKSKANGKVKDVKVNLICQGGRRWIRVLSGMTVVRLGFELAEDGAFHSTPLLLFALPILTYDSRFPTEAYESDSSSSSRASCSSTSSSTSSILALKQSPLYNARHSKTSLHKAAHSLLSARSNLSPLVVPPPTIELQLPRFTKDALSQLPAEHERRVEQVLDEVRGLEGVEVTLGAPPPSDEPSSDPVRVQPALQPTRNIVLDLSLIIALISGISHLPLPPASQGPEGVFLPLIRRYKKDGSLRSEEEKREAMLGGSENVRALTIQLGVEMEHPLVDELVGELAGEGGDVVFWATTESRERLDAIVKKLASEEELKRAKTMWFVEGEVEDDFERRTTAWWNASRHRPFLTHLHRSLSSVRTLPSTSSTDDMALSIDSAALASVPSQFGQLRTLLQHILLPSSPKLPPSLTPHTVKTLMAASSRGWTTISTNRASLVRLWKFWEDAGAEPALGTSSTGDEEGEVNALVWLVEPRSLAESMRVVSE